MAYKYKYYLTETANLDLDEIINYISVELSNPKAAKLLINDFENAIDTICTFPESGTLLNNEYLHVNNIRKKVIKNYTIYYINNENDDTILILRILSNRQNLSRVMFKL